MARRGEEKFDIIHKIINDKVAQHNFYQLEIVERRIIVNGATREICEALKIKLNKDL